MIKFKRMVCLMHTIAELLIKTCCSAFIYYLAPQSIHEWCGFLQVKTSAIRCISWTPEERALWSTRNVLTSRSARLSASAASASTHRRSVHSPIHSKLRQCCRFLLYTGLSKKMDGIWNRYNLKSTGRIYTFGVLKCSESFKVLDLP